MTAIAVLMWFVIVYAGVVLACGFVVFRAKPERWSARSWRFWLLLFAIAPFAGLNPFVRLADWLVGLADALLDCVTEQLVRRIGRPPAIGE